MTDFSIAYIRPHARSSEEHQRDMVAAYNPDRVLVAGDATLDDVLRFMSRAGRILIVPQLAAIDRKRSRVAEIVTRVLSAGCTIIEANSDRVVEPDCLDAILVGLNAPRHDVDRKKVRTSAKMGGSRSPYTQADLDATKSVWLSTELTQANCKALTGFGYSTLSRHWLQRAVPVVRPVGRGRR